jgi:hypothetical protein
VDDGPVTEQLEVERWFLREGMPWVLPDRRAHPAVARMLPVTAAIAVSAPVFALVGGLLVPGGASALSPELGLLVLAAGLVGVLVAVAGAVVLLRLRRSRPALHTRAAGWAGLGAALLLDGVSTLVVNGPAAAGESVLQTAAVLAGLLLAVVLGLGALVAWALRRLVGEWVALLSVVSRAIPPLLLLVAFLFINAEAWQMSANLTRGRLWAVVAFLLAVLLLFLVFRLPREVSRLDVPVDLPTVRRGCADTPLAPWAARMSASPRRHPLRPVERANLVALLFVAQAIQVLALAFAVFLLFVGFGSVAITDVTIEEWIGRPPTPGVFWGLAVPVPNELVNVCIVIAALSALYFGIYSVTDQEYRAEFLDDLLAELRVGLQAREVYLETIARE